MNKKMLVVKFSSMTKTIEEEVLEKEIQRENEIKHQLEILEKYFSIVSKDKIMELLIVWGIPFVNLSDIFLECVKNQEYASSLKDLVSYLNKEICKLRSKNFKV
jgi:hypothetical protein